MLDIKLFIFLAICFAISIAEGNDAILSGTTSGLFIEYTYQETTSSQVIYNITIKNSGDIKVRDIIVEDTLPANMIYVRSSYPFSKDGVLGEPRQDKNSDGTTLAWSIGDLVSDQFKTIQLIVTHSGESGAKRSNVIVIGSVLGTQVVTPSREAQPEIGPLD
jgi:uncharacterized repeat protein (TIGR01451 family)